MDEQEDKRKQGLPLYANIALEIKYSEAIRALIFKMANSTNREIKTLFQREYAKKHFKLAKNGKKNNSSTLAKIVLSGLFLKFKKIFDSESFRLATRMILDMEKYSSSTVNNSLSTLAGKTINTRPTTKEGMNIRKALMTENESLINSLPDQYFTNVTGAVMRAISTGLSDEIPAMLDKQERLALRRANTIAVDQTRKAMQSISKQKMIDEGFNHFRWVYTYRSREPRPSHIKLGGQVFSFDNPPIVNADNHSEAPRKGFPGSEINCKCVMRPVGEWEKKNAIKIR